MSSVHLTSQQLWSKGSKLRNGCMNSTHDGKVVHTNSTHDGNVVALNSTHDGKVGVPRANADQVPSTV